jgi:hypothetical protein
MDSSRLQDDYGAQRARQAVAFLLRVSMTTLVVAAAAATVLAYVLAWVLRTMARNEHSNEHERPIPPLANRSAEPWSQLLFVIELLAAELAWVTVLAVGLLAVIKWHMGSKKRHDMPTEQNLWRYRSGLEISSDLTGFSIEALDGGVGKVDECSTEVTGTYLVVDTGPWIFGEKVMLPGGLIDRIEYDSQTVFVNRTKDEIKNAPKFDPNGYRHDSYRTELGRYYGDSGPRNSEHRAHSDQLS